MIGDGPGPMVEAIVEAMVDTLLAIHGWCVVQMPFLLRMPITRSSTSSMTRTHVLPRASTRFHDHGLSSEGRIHLA